MRGRLAGKKALITGAAGGLGEAMAKMFAREGAIVAVTDLDEAGAQKVAGAINGERAGRALAYAHDVTSEDAWVDVLKRANKDMSGLSVLVHNAGIGGELKFVEASSLEVWRKVHAVNTESILLGTKHAMPYLRANQPGAIVVISSIAGLLGYPGMGAYNSAKAGAWLISKTIALECAKEGLNVRCNSIHPAFIKTPIIDPFVAMSGGDEAAAHARLARGIPLGHIGEPDDVAYAALYLASDESKFVTGAELKVDGGMSAQ
jgi:NAD(P)-dependent dehydrogenase (short-subunit alcohol dehydrogenase family)